MGSYNNLLRLLRESVAIATIIQIITSVRNH